MANQHVRQTLKMNYSDFWEGDLINDEPFFKTLAKKYDLEIVDSPDILFFSCFGHEHLKYKCLKVFLTGENIKPDLRFCDYSFSFEPTTARHFQLPNFVRYDSFPEFRQQQFGPVVTEMRNHPKTEFCNFVYSNKRAKERIVFCKKLMKYKRVDCPGPVLNNMPTIDKPNKPSRIMNKLYFIKKYKFTIAFENESDIGYVTEKIFQPLLVGSIPIYWGSPQVTQYFNPKSFINCHDYQSFDEVIERVIEIDNDDNLYQQYLSERPFGKESKIHQLSEEAVLNRLEKIIGSIGKVKPVSQKRVYLTHKLLYILYFPDCL